MVLCHSSPEHSHGSYHFIPLYLTTACDTTYGKFSVRCWLQTKTMQVRPGFSPFNLPLVPNPQPRGALLSMSILPTMWNHKRPWPRPPWRWPFIYSLASGAVLEQFAIFVRFSSHLKIEAQQKYSVCSFQKVFLAGISKMVCKHVNLISLSEDAEESRLLPIDLRRNSA